MTRFLRNQSGATAAEFALVLPLLLLLIFGVIDGARFIWEYNRAEKATQIGVRVAVVTTAIPQGLIDAEYVGVNGLTQGDLIPASALGAMICSRMGCANPPCIAPCPPAGTINTEGFDEVLGRMQDMKPDITADNVRVEYRGSGLGFAGDPNGMEVSPLVTVRLTGLTFTPITSLLLADMTIPDLSSTLTAEDSAGTQSN